MPSECVQEKCDAWRDITAQIAGLCRDVLDEQCSWSNWTRNDNNKLALFPYSGTVYDCIKALSENIDSMNSQATFREHIFTARKITMLPGEVIMLMDFAKIRIATGRSQRACTTAKTCFYCIQW